MKRNNFWYGTATMVGSIVGVGIFGIPFVFVKAGIIPSLLFLFGLGFLVILLNLMYGEIVLRTETKHHITGYAEKYLGSISKKFLLFTHALSIYGAMLSYLIVNGGFLSNIFSNFFRASPDFWSSVFFIVIAIFVLIGIRAVARFDLMMLIFLGFLIIMMIFFGTAEIDIANYASFTGQFWFLPFGVILFALSGMAGVPLVREAMGDKGSKLKMAIFWGTLFPAILYLIFAMVVVGVSGDITSPDAISGLSSFLGEGVIFLGSIFGALAIAGAFLGLGLVMRETFEYDFGLSKVKSWLLALLPPYFLFLSGMRNFIDVIGLVGGVALSIEGIFLLFMYTKARKNGNRLPEYSINIPQVLIYFIMAIFGFAAVYTLIS